MGDLYDLRSKLVHGGDAENLSDRDLKRMSKLAEDCIILVLTDRRFKNFSEQRDFDAWFDKLLFE